MEPIHNGSHWICASGDCMHLILCWQSMMPSRFGDAELPKRMSTSVKMYTLNLVSALRTTNSVHDELFYTAGTQISTG